eukprot:TRINITY_DN93972_c0_g1_i1.p1 TRINITY_DN93972_c0_g1~~TRINITY_DN93972_c0_g1_i1.p1  ORF type:complete len:542 (-),score=26.72 TRINITY_DN93972_c0_g1_i1:118-1743(-)
MSTDPATRMRLEGNKKFKSGDFKGAVQLYTQGIALQPSSALFGNRSQARLKLQQYHQAADDATRCVQLDPTFVKGHVRRGVALTALGSLDEALKSFTMAAELGEQVGMVEAQRIQELQKLLHNGNTLYSNRKFGAYVEHVTPVLAKVTHDVNLKCKYLDACYHTYNWESIVFALSDVLQHPLFRDNMSHHYLCGLAHYNMAEFSECIVRFGVVIETQLLKPADPNGFDDPKDSLEWGHYEMAVKMKKNAETLNETVAQVKNMIKTHEADGGREIVTKAMRVDESCVNINRYLHFVRATVGMHLGEYEKAIDDCNSALFGTKGHWRIPALHTRAACNEALGNISKAFADYSQIIKLDANNKLAIDRQQSIKSSKRPTGGLGSHQLNYYDCLGLPRNAGLPAVKAAYRKLALDYHPDRQSGRSEYEKALSTERFQEIGEAFIVLSDPEKRKVYDRGGDVTNMTSSCEPDPYAVFDAVCGGGTEDDTMWQKTTSTARAALFWTGYYLWSTATCPCWGTRACLQDQTQREQAATERLSQFSGFWK